MKRLLLAICAVALFASCSDKLQKEDDPADAFVGAYTFTDSYYVTWGSDSRALSSTGTFKLTKVSSKQVKMTGAWTSLGQVSGNTVSFSIDTQSDASGYITYTFGVGTLTGYSLSFSYYGNGSLKYSNGIAYPWTCSGQVLATKIE